MHLKATDPPAPVPHSRHPEGVHHEGRRLRQLEGGRGHRRRRPNHGSGGAEEEADVRPQGPPGTRVRCGEGWRRSGGRGNVQGKLTPRARS